MSRIILLLSVAVGLAWPQGERAADASDLLAADRAFYEATTERGLDGWLEWFAPDATVLTADGRFLSGADELRTYYGMMGVPPPGFRWTPDSAELAESGDLGYSVGSWEIELPKGAPADAPVPGGRYLTVWRRQPDGSFRVLADSGGTTDFRTRLTELDSPPREWSCTTERMETADSGELAIAMGSWKARGTEKELEGSYLSVWKRTEDGAWQIASETGFDR